ncbi:uncharacterized protein [Hemitrygon akajei]|uniref:uncharacterized protein n=1 Tax=Hemitrygon akajei TaxID=2704970 RepID=UPI003BF98641
MMGGCVRGPGCPPPVGEKTFTGTKAQRGGPSDSPAARRRVNASAVIRGTGGQTPIRSHSRPLIHFRNAAWPAELLRHCGNSTPSREGVWFNIHPTDHISKCVVLAPLPRSASRSFCHRDSLDQASNAAATGQFMRWGTGGSGTKSQKITHTKMQKTQT